MSSAHSLTALRNAAGVDTTGHDLAWQVHVAAACAQNPDLAPHRARLRDEFMALAETFSTEHGVTVDSIFRITGLAS